MRRPNRGMRRAAATPSCLDGWNVRVMLRGASDRDTRRTKYLFESNSRSFVKFSIVTICYNQAPFVEHAIMSVTSQAGPEYEYIVVDAGSIDGSREIIREHATDIQTIMFEPDEGPAHGLNKGFRRASGDIFGFLNADDALLPGALAEAAAVFDGCPEVDVVYGDGLIIDAHGVRIRRFHSNRFALRPFLYGAAVIMQPSMFIRSAAFTAVGGFNVKNESCWDAELILDLASHGARFRHVRREWSEFRIHAASITGSRRLADVHAKERLRLIEKAYGSCPSSRSLRRRRAAARVGKWIRHPRDVSERIADTVRLRCWSGKRP